MIEEVREEEGEEEEEREYGRTEGDMSWKGERRREKRARKGEVEGRESRGSVGCVCPAGIFLLAPTRKCFQRRIRLENWRSGVFHLPPDFIRKSGAS